jgi:hypothetical protein
MTDAAIVALTRADDGFTVSTTPAGDPRRRSHRDPSGGPQAGAGPPRRLVHG